SLPRRRTPCSTLVPYTTLFRSLLHRDLADATAELGYWLLPSARGRGLASGALRALRDWCCDAGYHRISLVANLDNLATHRVARRDRKSTRLNSSPVKNSYAVFC